MISEAQATLHCFEDISLIENYEQAINDKTQMWECHHRWETDRGLSAKELIFCCEYDYVPADRLIFSTVKEHRRLHGYHQLDAARQKISEALRGKPKSDATKQKMSDAKRGTCLSEATKQKMSEAWRGKPKSEATKEKIGEAKRGMHWWNNGIKNVRAKECPEGFIKGQLRRKYI